jgi:hypothetical protein
MLKSACMDLGAHYCRGLISTLCVGDTMILVTLSTIAICEALLIWFLVHAWRTSEPRHVVVLAPRSLAPGARRAGSAHLDASPS